MKFINFMTFQVFHDLYEPYFFMGIKYAKWQVGHINFVTKVNLLVPQSNIHVHCTMYITPALHHKGLTVNTSKLTVG